MVCEPFGFPDADLLAMLGHRYRNEALGGRAARDGDAPSGITFKEWLRVRHAVRFFLLPRGELDPSGLRVGDHSLVATLYSHFLAHHDIATEARAPPGPGAPARFFVRSWSCRRAEPA